MRYLIFLVALGGLISAAFSFSEITLNPLPQGLVLEVRAKDFTVEEVKVEDETYTLLSLPGEEGTTQEIGRPQLPKIARSLGIPDNAEVKVEILERHFRTYENILLYPYQPPTTDAKTLADFVIDRDFYNKAISYPENNALVAHRAWWREVNLVNLDIVPFTYNPKERRLLFFDYLKIKITWTNSFKTKTVEPWLAGIYKRTLLNYDYYPWDCRYLDSPGIRYLVITHTDFVSGLDSLLFWHKKRGIETRVIAKSSFTAQEIKDSISAEYNRNSPPVLRWVLLVGDVNRLPPSYAYSTNFPSDFWYCDLLGNDFYGEVGIGRFSVDSVTDLENMIKKTLKYEKNPPLDEWLTKSVLVAHKEQYPGKYSGCKRGIYFHTYPYYRFVMDTVMGQFLGNPAVAAAINEGRNVVNYRGHGDKQIWASWGATGSWSNSDVYALTNGDKTPVVFNIACYCHKIDYTADCLGEAWLKKYPGGAVASLGASDPSYTIPNHGLDSMLYRCLGDTISIPTPARTYKAPMWDLGWLLLFGDAHMALKHGSSGQANVKMYFWLGDPALEIWTGIPAPPSVQYQPVVPVGPYTFRVQVRKEGNPYKDALVCAWKGGEFYTFGYTNDQGLVDLNINAQTPGEFLVTVTGHEILPFEGRAMAATSNRPYLVYQKSIIDDAPPGGNGDGIINPGERINLPTWVRNLGGAAANNCRGKIKTTDPLITITDSLKTFGNIPANDSAFTGANGYKFYVSPSCPNRYALNFTLEMRDANDSVWNSQFSLLVGTPSLVYHSLRVIDSTGNNNQRVDPGEAANLVVEVKNNGLGHGYNVRGTLYSLDSRFFILDPSGDYGFIPVDSVRGNEGDRFTVYALPSIPPETPIPCSLYLTADGGYSVGFRFTLTIGQLQNTDPTPDDPVSSYYVAFEDVDSTYPARPVYNWIELRGRGTQLPIVNNDQTIRIPLPFTFKFYGQRYTDSLSVCSNGWISPIRTTSTVYTNRTLPDPSSGNPSAMICPCWDDLDPRYGNKIWYLYEPDSHRFILEWDSVHYYSPNTQWDKFQIIVYDTTIPTPTGDNIILFQYYSANNYTSVTVGIENHLNNRGINLLYNNNYHKTATTIVPGRAIKFATEPWVGIEERLPLIAKRLPLRVYPNPFHNKNIISFTLSKGGDCEIKIYDVAGKVVRELLRRKLAAGEYSLYWDGKDNYGRKMSKGIYLYRIKTPEKSMTIKTVLTE